MLSERFPAALRSELEKTFRKTKNRKINFSLVSEHCSTFWTTNPKWLLLRERGGGGLHVVN